MHPTKKIIYQAVALATALLVLAYLTFWYIGTWELRVTFFALGMITSFLYYSEGRQSDEVALPAAGAGGAVKASRWFIPPADLLLIALTIAAWVYTMASGVALIQRAGRRSPPMPTSWSARCWCSSASSWGGAPPAGSCPSSPCC